MNISIELLKNELVNDLLTHCNQIASVLVMNPETEELGNDIMTPDDKFTKPIVARSLTMAFGKLKGICQKYLLYGRYSDDNRLEKIDETNHYDETVQSSPLLVNCKYSLLTGIPYVIKASADKEVSIMDNEGKVLGRGTDIQFSYTPVRMFENLTVKSTEQATVNIEYRWGEFGKFELLLEMPSRFNIGLTETIKSLSHACMVDYTMYAILKDRLPEKAQEYAAMHIQDAEELRKALRARTAYGRPYAADWS